MKKFFDYYESLSQDDRQVFRKRIIKACLIEPPTWYSWMKRHRIPKPAQKLIALEMGQPMDVLFPETED
ncbi:MAG: hypothetical protein AB7U05_09195 [Mangrovibacterium sp.]